MLIPQYLILAVMVSIGIFPGFYFGLLFHPLLSFLPQTATSVGNLFVPITGTLSGIGLYALIFIGLSLLIYFIRVQVSARRPVETGPTWGCGYIAPDARMQYTGKSFSKSMGKLLDFIVLENKRYREIPVSQVFPETRKHSSHYIDFFEIRIFNRITERIVFSMNYFKFIQNGKTQAYVLYGLFFILIIFLGTIFKFM
jgi:hypothetical protein